MAEIVLENISKQFGKDTVIPKLNLRIKDGSFTVLVGPSGCGKSTTLRLIAGLETPTSGELSIGGKRMNDVRPGKRDVAMVFQNYALYPTMTVKENIEFGLVNRKVPKKGREALVTEICEIVGLAPYLNRKPSTLSGGQRQRVALARAMVKKPQVFLMDEPLSNLDAQLRNQMRLELVQLHRRLQTTFVFVTHDQVEAMSLGDEIVIMDKGVIQQAANPVELYKNPNNLFSARFIGMPPMNVLPAANILAMTDIQHRAEEDIQHLGFRPEKALLHPDDQTASCLRIGGVITARETLGSETIYQILSAEGEFLVKSYDEPREVGSTASVFIAAGDLFYFDGNGNRVRERVSAVGDSSKVGAGGTRL
jgi:sn-glycerol 3-phosphate transport system ATP-binding protein